MKHCWHKDATQYTTWTPGEPQDYTCCHCGERLKLCGTVAPVAGHGPYVRIPPVVTYELPDRECPAQGKPADEVKP